MNKILASITGLAMVALVAGCSSTTEQPAAASLPPPDCLYDGTEKAAPLWICGEAVPGWEVTAVGTAEKTAAGIDFQKQMALTAARVQLAQQIKVHVANMVKQFAEVTGAAESETVDQARTSVTKQITDQSLEGSKLIRNITGPNGIMYVLVGLDANAAQAVTKNAVKTSMKNEQALWQKFQAKMSQDEMAEEIAKQRAQ